MLNHASNRRILICYPIIHTQIEMVTLQPIIEKLIVKKVGEAALASRYDELEPIWVEVKDSVAILPLFGCVTRIYQDGLPVCSRESAIVTDLVRMGSINHQIATKQQVDGAILMGTECPDLLVEKYRLTKNIFTLNVDQTLDTTELKILNDSITHQ